MGAFSALTVSDTLFLQNHATDYGGGVTIMEEPHLSTVLLGKTQRVQTVVVCGPMVP